MYCGICGSTCIIPAGYGSDKSFGVIYNIERTMYKVIRCVECANRVGVDTRFTFICVRSVGTTQKKVRVTDKQIASTMFTCCGNKSEVARHLGISVRTVRRRTNALADRTIRSHGIDPKDIMQR